MKKSMMIYLKDPWSRAKVLRHENGGARGEIVTEKGSWRVTAFRPSDSEKKAHEFGWEACPRCGQEGHKPNVCPESDDTRKSLWAKMKMSINPVLDPAGKQRYGMKEERGASTGEEVKDGGSMGHRAQRKVNTAITAFGGKLAGINHG